jgi:hypothetical protein
MRRPARVETSPNIHFYTLTYTYSYFYIYSLPGDYYPCRCEEKGRNTSSSYSRDSIYKEILSKEYNQRHSINGRMITTLSGFLESGLTKEDMQESYDVDKNSLKAEILKKRNSIVKSPRLEGPCKWCMDSFTPCRCQEDIPVEVEESRDEEYEGEEGLSESNDSKQ